MTIQISQHFNSASVKKSLSNIASMSLIVLLLIIVANFGLARQNLLYEPSPFHVSHLLEIFIFSVEMSTSVEMSICIEMS